MKIDAFNHIMLQFSWVFGALPDTHHGIQLFEQENAVWTLVSATFLCSTGYPTILVRARYGGGTHECSADNDAFLMYF